MKWLMGLVLVVLLAGGYYYWKNSYSTMAPTSSSSTASDTPTAVPSTAPLTGSSSAGTAMTAQEISISATEFAFTPSKLTVKVGQPVKLTFTNNGNYPHNVTISDLNVATKTVPAGGTDSVEFTPDKAGTYKFMCTVDSHADKGMTGTLTVQ